MPDKALIDRFAALVAPGQALSEPADLEAYLTEQRGLYRGETPLLLKPGSVAEVSAILRLAHETATPVVPQGGNTGLTGAQVPRAGTGETDPLR